MMIVRHSMKQDHCEELDRPVHTSCPTDKVFIPYNLLHDDRN